MLSPRDPRDLATRVAELERRLSNVLRYGTIHDVEGWRVRVAWGVQSDGEPALSAWVPWLTMRAGAALTWSPPSAGERCLLLSPEGDMRMGVAALALYSAPLDVPAGGPGTVTIAGDVTIMGAVHVDGPIVSTGAITGADVRARFGDMGGPVDLGSHLHASVPPTGSPLPSGASFLPSGNVRMPDGTERQPPADPTDTGGWTVPDPPAPEDPPGGGGGGP